MKIEIIVSPKGETKIETKGFSGAECREASRAMEQALGMSAEEHLTAEFYHMEKEQLANRQRA